MKLKYIGTLFLVFAISFVLSYYMRNSDFVRELFNPKTKIEFHNATFDFGDISSEKEAVTYFVYTNTGEHSLKIINIQSSCGCTVPKWSRKKLEPGKKDSIMVMYDAENYGYFSKAIYVFSNAESSPDALYIEGTVVEEK
jgi:hypothetical protein